MIQSITLGASSGRKFKGETVYAIVQRDRPDGVDIGVLTVNEEGKPTVWDLRSKLKSIENVPVIRLLS